MVGKISKLLSDRYFWSSAALFGTAIIATYLFPSRNLSRLPFGMSEHDFELLAMVFQDGLFLAAIIIAAWRYKFKWGLALVFTVGLTLLPHIIVEMAGTFRVGHLSLYIIGTFTGVGFSYLVGYRKQAEERIIHLTAVLRAIRNVNQLITHEKDRQNLIQRSCKLLAQRQGYEKAWILLFDENKNFGAATGTGFDENTFAFLKKLETGNYPECVKELLSQEQSFLAYDRPGKRHDGCVLAGEHSTQGIFRGKLEYEGKLYGVLGVTVPLEMVDDEEQSLFLELCDDVAFALAGIEQEEKRRQAEEALKRAEQNFRNSLDNSPLGIRIVNPDGGTIYANLALLDIYGFDSLEELKRTPNKKTYTPESYAEHRKRVEKRQRGEYVPSNYEISIVCKDGKIKHLSVSHKEVMWDGSTQFQTVYQDITERKHAEEDIRRLLDKQVQYTKEWQETFDAITEIVVLIAANYDMLRINKAGCQALGGKGEEYIGKKCYEIVHRTNAPIEECPCIEMIKTKKAAANEYTDPRGRNYLLTAYPIFDKDGEMTSFTHTVVDITEAKNLQKQVISQDRLASIGQLVSGVAHEINNPLTSVVGFSELLLKRELPDDIKSDLKIINDEAKRTAMIVKNLLTFARKQPEGKTDIQVNDEIRGVLALRKYEQTINNITVNERLAQDLPRIKGNSSQIKQVIFNVIVNAEQVMLEANGRGIITVTTAQLGDTVQVSIADNGPGISSENMDKLFTPFFTTKGVGKGTGLGLSISQGIVSEHGGKIYAKSELGKGATFIVELPVHKSPS